MRVICNVCHSKATINSRNQQSAEVADLYCRCDNPKCNHFFVMTLGFSHTLAPSALNTKQALVELLGTLSEKDRAELFKQNSPTPSQSNLSFN